MAYPKQRPRKAMAGYRRPPRRWPAAGHATSVFVNDPLFYFLSAWQELGDDKGKEHGQADFPIHAGDEDDVTANGRPFPERSCLPIDAHESRKSPDSRKDDEPHEGHDPAADPPALRAKRRILEAHVGDGDDQGQKDITDHGHDGTGTAVDGIGSDRDGNDKETHEDTLPQNIAPPTHFLQDLLKQRKRNHFSIPYPKRKEKFAQALAFV